MFVDTERVLPVTEPVATLTDYLAIGGGQGLAAARGRGPEWVIDEVGAAGLRGRGGAGFPTATKWAAATSGWGMAANATDGPPGAAKNRYLIGRNPYQVVEGLMIAALAVRASRALIVVDRQFEWEIARLCAALDEMLAADLLGAAPVRLGFGPVDDLATINNVETLAHVPEILRRGAEWFRENETTVIAVSGDVCRPGVFELPLGVPLRVVVELFAGGVRAGRTIRDVVTEQAMLTDDQLDTPLDLGIGSLVVYDDRSEVKPRNQRNDGHHRGSRTRPGADRQCAADQFGPLGHAVEPVAGRGFLR